MGKEECLGHSKHFIHFSCHSFNTVEVEMPTRVQKVNTCYLHWHSVDNIRVEKLLLALRYG